MCSHSNVLFFFKEKLGYADIRMCLPGFHFWMKTILLLQPWILRINGYDSPHSDAFWAHIRLLKKSDVASPEMRKGQKSKWSSLVLAYFEQFWCLSQSKSFFMWIEIWTSIFNHSSQSAGHMLVEDCYHSFWPLWIANMLPSRQGGLKEQSFGSTGSMIGKVLNFAFSLKLSFQWTFDLVGGLYSWPCHPICHVHHSIRYGAPF